MGCLLELRCTLFTEETQDRSTKSLDLGAKAVLDHQACHRIDAVVVEELDAFVVLLVLS